MPTLIKLTTIIFLKKEKAGLKRQSLVNQLNGGQSFFKERLIKSSIINKSKCRDDNKNKKIKFENTIKSQMN